MTGLPPELKEWIMSKLIAATPEEWAEEALAAAQVKKTRRTHLRPHLARTIKLAQEVAAADALAKKSQEPVS